MLRPIAILSCLGLGLWLLPLALALGPAGAEQNSTPTPRFAPGGKPVPPLPASVVCEEGWTIVLTPRLVWMCAKEMKVPR